MSKFVTTEDPEARYLEGFEPPPIEPDDCQEEQEAIPEPVKHKPFRKKRRVKNNLKQLNLF